MRVTPETAKRLSTVIACVTARGRMMSILDIDIRTDVAGGGSRSVPNHPLYDVLRYQPNPWQTAGDFKMMMQAHVDLRGNAYAEKIAGARGPVDQLIPMHPDRVKVEILKDTGRLRYIYDDPLTGAKRILMQDEVFHLRDWAENYAVGQSRISMALDTIGLGLAIQDYRSNFLKNDARSGLVVTRTAGPGSGNKTMDDDEELVKSIQAGNTRENRGRAMFLPPGLEAKYLGVTPVDAQLLESAKATQVEICNIMGVLPHTVGVDAGKAATFASTEQFNIMDAQRNVHPMTVMWKQCIKRDLIVSSRFFAAIPLDVILMGDTATRFAAYGVAITYGLMCPDEGREAEGRNPSPDGQGKVFWRSANLLPLKQLAAPAPKPFPPGKGGKPDDGGDDDEAEDDGSGSNAQANAAMQARMELLASASAERCVRREVSGVTKLIERSAGAYEVINFYAEQTRFIVEVFQLEALGELNVRIGCDARAQQLSAHLADEEDEYHAAAQMWIQNVAATEAVKLAKIAVEGVL